MKFFPSTRKEGIWQQLKKQLVLQKQQREKNAKIPQQEKQNTV